MVGVVIIGYVYKDSIYFSLLCYTTINAFVMMTEVTIILSCAHIRFVCSAYQWLHIWLQFFPCSHRLGFFGLDIAHICMMPDFLNRVLLGLSLICGLVSGDWINLPGKQALYH